MIRTYLYCCLISVLIAIPAAFFTKSIWGGYLNKTPPQISLLSNYGRVGVGSAGGKLEIEVTDQEPGIDEVVVRLRQLRSDRELFRKKLQGSPSSKLSIEIAGQDSNVEQRTMVGEGSGEIEIVAFDRSFYNNKAVVTTKAFVDTKPPNLEVLSSQHNLRQGGSQLVLYSARDDNLSFSGVRVGTNLFEGFPAGQLDSALNREGLYAALYSVPVGSSVKAADIKLRAVDVGGNAVEQSFYNKVAKRVTRTLSPNNARLVSWLVAFTPSSAKPSSSGSSDDKSSAEQTSTKNSDKKAAAVDAATLVQSFENVAATAVIAYGDKISLPQKTALETGSLFVFTGISEAKALHSGEISSVRLFEGGLYEISINHGLGLFSSYKGLRNAVVREGQQVKTGENLGAIDSYLGIGASVSGQPVDPTEWWSQDWVSAHIYEKIEEVKKSLGIVAE